MSEPTTRWPLWIDRLNFSLREAEVTLWQMVKDGEVDAQPHLAAIWEAQKTVSYLLKTPLKEPEHA